MPLLSHQAESRGDSIAATAQTPMTQQMQQISIAKFNKSAMVPTWLLLCGLERTGFSERTRKKRVSQAGMHCLRLSQMNPRVDPDFY